MWIAYVYTLHPEISSPGDLVSKKDDKKAGKKDAQLILRMDKKDRDAFVELCKELDTSAAREIRGFIRDFLKKNQG